MIEIKNLFYQNYKLFSLNNISFCLERGKILGIYGSQVSGKADLFRLISGELQPTSGGVLVCGVPPYRQKWGKTPKVIRVSYDTMKQEEHYNLLEIFQYTAVAYGTGDEILKLLGYLGLSAHLSTPLYALTPEERFKTVLGLALLAHPELLLLEDLIEAMDCSERLKTWDFLEDLRQNGLTLVVSSYREEDLCERSDVLGILHEGNLKAFGAPQEIFIAAGQTYLVTFSLTEDMLEHFPNPLKPLLKIHGKKAEIQVRDPAPLLADITHWAFRQRIPLKDLEVTRPTLKKFYLDQNAQERENMKALPGLYGEI